MKVDIEEGFDSINLLIIDVRVKKFLDLVTNLEMDTDLNKKIWNRVLSMVVKQHRLLS